MNKKNIYVGMIVFFVVLGLIAYAAPPSLPANILGYGNYSNGSRVGAGYTVYAYIDGSYVDSGTTIADGSYLVSLGTDQYSTGDNVTLIINQSDWLGQTILLSIDEGANYPDNIVISDQNAPSAPSGLNAQEISTGIINITWNAATDGAGVESYSIYRSATSGFTAALSNYIGNSLTLNYTDTVTADGSTYYYKVAANDTSNQGNTSSQISITVTDAEAPSAPTGLAATDISDAEGTLNITWDANSESDIDKYIVYFSTDNTNFIFESSTSSLYYSDSGLTDGTTYYYKIAVNDTSGNPSSNTSSVSGMPVDDLSPSAVTGLSASDISGSEGKLNISFTQSLSDDASGYLLFKDGSFLINMTGKTNTSVLVSSTDGTLHTIKVSTYDDWGNYAANATANGTSTDSLAPGTIQNFAAESFNTTMNLTWDTLALNSDSSVCSDLSGYLVFFSEDNDSFSLESNISSGTTYYSDTSLTNGNTYYYKISAYDDDGNIGVNSSVSGSPSERPSISEEPSSSVISSGVQINFSITSGQTLDSAYYKIYNSTGSLIASVENTSISTTSIDYEIDVSGWKENDWHRIAVYANDTNSQSNQQNYTYKVDDTIPSVINPAISDSDSIVKINDLKVFNVTVIDATTCTVTAGVVGNEVRLSNLSNLYYASTTPSLLGCTNMDAACEIKYIATDAAGNINSTTTLTITVDSTVPTISDKEVSDNIINSTTNIQLNATVTDTNAISTVTVSVGVGTTLSMTNLAGNVYSRYVNATALGCSEGVCQMKIAATDVAGNVENSTKNVIIDDTEPTLGYAVLSTNYVQNNTEVTITLNATDLWTVDSVVAEGTSLSYQGDDIWNGTITLLDTENDVVDIVVTDSAGNQLTDNSTTYTIDGDAPVLNSISLSDSIVQNNTAVNITLNLTDSTVMSKKYSIFKTGAQTISTSYGSYFSAGIQTILVNLTSDITNITIWVKDNASNEMAIVLNNVVNFTIDDIAPVISSTYPINGSWIKSTTPNIRYLYNDNVSLNSTCVLTINQVEFSTHAYNGSLNQIDILGASLQSGSSYDWQVVCADDAGNEGSLVRTFSVDTIKPVTNISYNKTSAVINWTNEPVKVNISATDNTSGVNYTQWKNSTSGVWVNVSESFNIDYNLAENIIYYRSVDDAGNVENTKQKRLYIDTVDPTTPTITLSSVNVSQDVTIDVIVSSSDALSGLYTTADYILNGTTGTLDLLNGKYRGTITAPSSDGTFNFTVNVSDNAGNIIQASKVITVNTTAPSISVDSASLSILENNTEVIITIGGSDVNGWYNGTSEGNITNGTATVTIDADSYVLNIYANNTVGTVNSNYTYYVDVVDPTLTISAPTNGSTINSTVTVSAVSADAGIGLESVVFSVIGPDSVTYREYTDLVSPYTFTLDTFAADDGNYTITVVSTDYYENAVTKSISVKINNTVLEETVSAQSGEVDFSSTTFGTVIDTISGVNDTIDVVVSVPLNVNDTPSSAQLSDTIYTLNITTDTPETSRVYFMIETSVLDSLSISAPYAGVYVYADHGSGIEAVGEASYSDIVILNENEYARFYFETSEYSVFFIGKKAVTEETVVEEESSTTSSSGSSDYAIPARTIFSWMWEDMITGQEIDVSIDEDIALISAGFGLTSDVEYFKLTVKKLDTSEADIPVPEYMYDLIDISLSGTSDDILENIILEFKVDKSWLRSNGLNENDMTLYRYNEGVWVDLEAEFVSEDTSYAYYKANTPGFSNFVVAKKDDIDEIPITGDVIEDLPDPNDNTGIIDDEIEETEKPDSEGLEGDSIGSRDKNSMWKLILVGIAIFGFIYAGYAYWIHNYEKKEELKSIIVEHKESKDPLVSFISSARKKGFTDKEIMKALKEHGWEDDKIESALKEK